ncbi:MAG: LamG-like jellyroll fold domain-containing protein, partial [Chloroflexota bacterium]|nr:LamG-like jellyroll fold domain-containing protein [Chloroflexota bacterium]
DEIWVAKGVYTPTNVAGRDAAFYLQSGVELYGGFDGSETSREQRDWQTHVTVLSGDVDGDDTTDANGVSTHWSHISGYNVWHVVVASSAGESGVLDGFSITGGCASMNTGSRSQGGGMYNNGGSPTLRNLTFSGNEASASGGGMHNSNGSPQLFNVVFSGNGQNTWDTKGGGMYSAGSGAPVLVDVTFSGNSADSGGGMYAGSGNLTLINVTFSANSTVYDGGGMYDSGGSSTLINVVFSANSADDGGGMRCDNSNPVLINVTFSGNSADPLSGAGGGMYIHDSSPTLVNSILWGNTANTLPQMAFTVGSASATINYSLIQGGCPGPATCNNVISDNPQFGSGLRLKDNSPAIDAGGNDGVPADTHDLDGDGSITEPLPYDRAGGPRLVEHPRSDTGNGDAPLVDMGAYERSVLVLEKSATPTMLEPGDPLTYVLAFKNDSTYTVTEALIADVIPTHLYDLDFDSSGASITPTGSVSYTWEVQDLLAGEGGIITVTGILDTSLLPGQSFDNVATFSGIAGGVDVVATASATVARHGADLAVSKRASHDPAVAGGLLTYTLTITNHGLFDSDSILLTDTLPGEVTFISASPGCNAAGSRTVTCTLGSLENQATAAFTIAVTAPVTVGQITNVVTVTTVTPDPDPVNNVATEITQVSAEADLALAKFAWPDQILTGGSLTYTLVVTNHGPDIASGVVLSDALPSGVIYAGRLLSLPMNEAAGAEHFTDVSGFGHHGACSHYYGTCPEAGVSGQYGPVLSFDGEDDWVESEDFDIGNDFTISLWVFPLKHDDGQAFISKHTAGGANLFIFGYYNGGYQVNLRNAAYRAGEKPTTTDLWYHLVVVGRETGPASTEVTVYRNGETLWQHDFATVAGNVTGKGWAIGQEWDSGTESDFFYGAMDEVNVYNRALSASEVAALYGPPAAVSPIVSQGTCALENESDGGLTCNLGTLTADTVATVTFPVRLSSTQTGTLTNTATVTSYVPDPTPGNNSDEKSTQIGTDLAVGKTDALDPVMPGERLTYTLTITRHNPADIIATRRTGSAANPSSIAIPTSPFTPVKALLYPSTISVSGLAGTVIKATVTLHNVTHKWVNQLDVLLVGPDGQSVILMSDAAGNFYYALHTETVTFDDDASSPVPEWDILPGDYRPSNYGADADSFPSPAPSGPYGAALSVFDGIRPNGDWRLYVVDDVPATVTGTIAGGWSLNLWTGSSGTVSDVLPAGVTFVSASPGCDESGGTVTCVMPVLGEQTTTTFTIAVTAPPSIGLITNTVSVAGFPPDLNLANDTATESTWVSAADLAVDKIAHTAIPLEGDKITYTVTLVNHGPSAATGIAVSDTLPGGITFGGYTATLGIYTNTTGAWHVGALATGKAATLTITGTVEVGTAGQTLTNTAVLSASAPADVLLHNNTAHAAITVASPDLVANKTVDTGGLAGVSLGGVVTYTLAVRNASVAAATSVVLTDPLPSAVTFRDWVVSSGATVTMQTVEWGPHDVAAYTAYTISFTADVTITGDLAGQVITNTVYVNASNADPTEDRDTFSIQGWVPVYLPLVLKSY